MVPQERLELSRLATLASKTSVSTIPPPGQKNLHLIFKERLTNFLVCVYYNIVVACCQPLSGTAYRNRTHIQEVEALCIIHYTKAVWCERRDSNPYTLRRQILSLLCIPFHHSRMCLGATSRNRTWFNGSSNRRYDHIS